MLVGKVAPEISCQAIIDNEIKDIKLSDFKNKYKVLFFYPLDFTFVCPTEMHAFQDLIEEFKKRDAVILGISIDSVYSHEAWLKQPKEEGGIHGVTFPLLSDITKTISSNYHVLDEKAGVALRGLFIIDQDNIIQSMQVNNLSVGRNIREVLRLIDAIDFAKNNKQVCPANWTTEQQALNPDQEGLSKYFKSKK